MNNQINGKTKAKIMILYHSGAGSTKTISKIFYEKLSEFFLCDIEHISFEYNFNKLLEYDFIIFGFPTYHCEASKSMMDFINKTPELSQSKNAFVFTTYGLYSGNAERIFIKNCKGKNINVCGSNAYKAPATDGALLFPYMNFMFEYGKDVTDKIKNDINFIKNILESKNYNFNYIPSFKLYTILNYPNKLFGKMYKHNFLILADRCISCNKCVNRCIRNCWSSIKNKVVWDSSNCEFCFKCVHHCPSSAIILSKKTLNKPKLNSNFYKKIKDKLLQNMDN